ncbi:hypothetical protein HT662_09475 [Ursidibacter maritimus]|nr:hypothetical protein [Ursidibacter maritimus]MBV6537889.1 hypothetical protein [Ursidibacter maritimus]
MNQNILMGEKLPTINVEEEKIHLIELGRLLKIQSIELEVELEGYLSKYSSLDKLSFQKQLEKLTTGSGKEKELMELLIQIRKVSKAMKNIANQITMIFPNGLTLLN